MANKHNEYVEIQQKKYSVLWNRYQETCRECDKYRQENEELKEKIQQYEDWIERLQEFMDMPKMCGKVRLKKCEQTKK